MNSSQIIFRGKTFTSLNHLAQAFDVHYGNLARRLRTGWSYEQALGLSPRPKGPANNAIKLKTVRGEYPSIRALAKATDVKEATIANRLRLGWTTDQAAGFVERPTKAEPSGSMISCAGQEFPSVAALARHYQKNYKLVIKRIGSGWTAEQAVELELKPPRFRDQSGAARDHAWTDKLTLEDGMVLPATKVGSYRLYSITNNAIGNEYIGITTGDLKSRLRGHWRMVTIGRKSKLYNSMRKAEREGSRRDFVINLIRNDAKDFIELQHQEIDEIEARDTIRRGYNTGAGGSIGTSKPIFIDGELFPSQRAAADFYGIDPQKFSLRIGRLGWSVEKAVGLTARDKFQHHEIFVGGIIFSSLRLAAKHFDIDYKTAYARYVHSQWTAEQTFGLEPPPSTVKFQGREVIVKGRIFRSIAAASRYHGLKAGTVNSRMHLKGQTAEEAINALLDQKQRQEFGLLKAK